LYALVIIEKQRHRKLLTHRVLNAEQRRANARASMG